MKISEQYAAAQSHCRECSETSSRTWHLPSSLRVSLEHKLLGDVKPVRCDLLEVTFANEQRRTGNPVLLYGVNVVGDIVALALAVLHNILLPQPSAAKSIVAAKGTTKTGLPRDEREEGERREEIGEQEMNTMSE